jgi:serine protease inhibitor
LLKVGEQGKLEAMTDSLGSEEDRVMQISAMLAMGLTTVKETWHFLSIDHEWLFMRQDLLTEGVYFIGEVLLVDHVESRNKLG